MVRGWRSPLVACIVALTAWAAGGVAAAAGPVVPTMTQRSPLWARDALGNDPVDTIGSSGCAVTAVSMVYAGFGYPNTPQTLNRWLTAHGGYIENDLLLWRQAALATQGMVRWQWTHVPGIVPQLSSDDQNIEDLPPQSLVEAQLDAGRLVVAEVRLHGNMHFVVITSHSGDTLRINDPWYGDRTTLQARYGTYVQAVHSVEIYYHR